MSAYLENIWGETTFTALNDKSFDIKTFEVDFSYSEGLSPSFGSISPEPGTAVDDTRQRVIKVIWSAVSPGTMLTVRFALYNSELGIHTLTPTLVKYTDYNRNTYYGDCNSATVTVKADTNPPAAPVIELSTMLGGVKIEYTRGNEPDEASPNIYRRAAGGVYQQIECTWLSSNACADTSAAAGQTYYYAAKATDYSGNESPFSNESAISFIPPALLASLTFTADSAATGDLNGDGLRDVVLGQTYFTKNKGGRVAVFYGHTGGVFSATPDYTIVSPETNDKFGAGLAVVNLNNDGYDDLIVGAPGHDQSKTSPVAGMAYDAGQIYVFAGGPQLSNTPVFAVPGDWAYDCTGNNVVTTVSELLGEKISPAGDVNDDGFQDAIIGAPNGGNDRSGKIVILYGGSTITANTSVLVNPTCGAELGKYVARAGDVNGDGSGEILAASNSGIHLILGGASPQLPMEVFGSSADSMIGLDFNGDGYSDVFDGSGVYFGSASWDVVQDLQFALTGATTIADVNGDGFSDLLSANGSIFFGNAVNDNLIDVQFELTDPVKLRGIGDANGDGIPDPIIVGDDGYIKVYSLAPLLALPEIVVSSHRDGDNSISNRIEGLVRGNPVRLVVGGIETPIQPNGSFSATLPLATGDQTLELLAEAADGRIGKRVLRFYYTQIDPLTVTIFSPADGAVVNDPALRVSGLTNYQWTSVTVNGLPPIPWDYSTGDFLVDIILTEGANLITAEAMDVHGQTGGTTITVHLQTTGGLTGTVTDASSGSPMPNVSVSMTDAQGNPFSAQTDSNGLYSLAGLKSGPFTGSFTQTGYFAYPASGNIVIGQTSTLDAILTPYPPLGLTISSPTDGQSVNETPINVTGTVTNNAAVTVNGVAALVSGGVFAVDISLAEGANAITASAVDQYNQTAAAGVTVSLVYLPPTVNISAVPAAVLPRQPSTLSWTSTDAQTATIEPEVGPVAPNGSVIVKPAQTTTYTITVTGPGGTAVDTVTVDVIPSTLAVSLAAEPSSIPVGTSTTLTWTSTDAQTVSIDQGVGPVALNGSVVVTPLDTTTYTISATGVDGTVVDSTTVTVIHPAPTVTISAAPESVKVGQAITLSWTSTTATSCVIDQGVGTVEPSGSAAVTPMETTVFTITATGPGGTASAQVTVDVDNPFTINIISPANLSAVNRPDVLVYGTVANVWNNETSITVNGELGLVDGNQFAANHVALSDGANTITVTATDEEGYRYSKSITVYANTAVDYVRLDPSPSEGAAGLESVLTVNGNVQITSSDFDWQGPAPVTFSAQTANSTTANIATPGLYYFTVEAHDATGNTYTDAAAVGVWNSNDLDALLRNKWGRLKTALASGDVATAVACHKEETRAGYQEIYTDLLDRLPSIVQNMGAITPVSIESDRAEYLIQRDDLIDGQIVTLAFSIYFSRDENGIWWLERY